MAAELSSPPGTIAVAPPAADPRLAGLVNLADARLGAEALFATDDFFAPKERMLAPGPAVFVHGKYDDHGKWMDGWESRRKRVEGHDHCVVKLGVPGSIALVDIDTSFFTGNFPPAASLDGCLAPQGPGPGTRWSTVLGPTDLAGDSHNIHAVTSTGTVSHVRLNIFPDGGVARLRVHGRVVRDWSGVSGVVDLAALANGGRAIGASDAHYGSPALMLLPGLGATMGDGWETRRRREPGNEWAVIGLGARGRIRRIEVDTTHFKGNFPDRCSIQAADVTGGSDRSAVTQSMFWRTLLPEQKLGMDRAHGYEREIADLGPITHIRFNNIPDGGVNRLRVLGEVA